MSHNAQMCSQTLWLRYTEYPNGAIAERRCKNSESGQLSVRGALEVQNN